MKGLDHVPSQAILLKAYEDFFGSPSPQQIAYYSQCSRFDPRLAEIWVKYVSANWGKMDPMALRKEAMDYPWSNCLGVLLEFVSKTVEPITDGATDTQGKDALDSLKVESDQKLFLAWKNLLLVGVEPAHFEQFFIGLRKIGGKLMLADATYSMQEYLKWGYLGREVLFNKPASLPFSTFSYDLETRKKIAQKIATDRSRFSTTDYWNAIGRSVSRRQAEKDLASFQFLKSLGNTKGRFFLKR